MKNVFLRTPMRVLTVVLMLFVVIPSSAFFLERGTTVVYYWKVKSGKKALARKVISKQKLQCSDKVLTPYKYDAKYGGKEAFKYSPYTNKYKKKNRKYFFDHYSIVSKGIDFLDYTPVNLYAFFAVKTDDGYGFLDDKGNEVVPCNYAEWSFLTPDYIYKKDDVKSFFQELYRSEVYDKKTKYYSTYWDFCKSTVYTYIQMRSKEGKWQSFSFSSKGTLKKSAQYDYDEVVPFAGYWDSYKSIKWHTTYSNISNEEFINNYMATRKGNSWGIYSLDAKREYVPCKFDKSSFIWDNSGKLVIVTVADNFFMKKGDMRCIVNEKGETVFSEKCNLVFPKYIKRGTWSHYYITNNNREFDLINECYKAPSPYSWSWLGWNYKGCQKIEQNNLCGLYNGKTDSILLPCQYKKIGFDKDNTGFLRLTTAEGNVLTACLTADANRVIFIDNKADIVKQSTIVSNKDGYTTYRIGSGYGFMCNATGVCTAPIFTPDTVKVSNPKNIPLCQFYRGVEHGGVEHGAFAGNHFFCPKYSQRIDVYKGDTLCIKKYTPYIANLKNGKSGYWVETIYTENGEVKVGNNMNQWLALLKNKNYSAESIYKPIDKLLLELNYVEHGYVWDSNYALELWRRGDYENAEYQLRLVMRWYKRSFPDKATMQQFYDDWTAYTLSVKNYSSAILACSQAKKGEYKVDSAQVKQILHDGPLYYALNGNLEKAKSLCQDGKQNFGIDQGDTFLNLVQSNYNLYLAREEARKREQETKRQEEERQRQLELQRQREEAERQRLQRQQAWNNLANALGNLSQSLSNLSNKKKGTSYNRTTPSYNTTSSARSSSRTSSTSANSRNQKKVLSSMSTLSSTYRSYQSMLIKMNTYYEKQYNDSDRRKYQQAMREIRLRAEQYSNCSVFKSEWEDWDGRKR